MISRNFVLASGSPRRQDLLVQIGMTPDIIDPADIDENPKMRELPRNYALRMALEKVQAVAERQQTEGFVLAADTVVALGRSILPKAGNDEIVKQCLLRLSGRRHRVYTALAVSHNNVIRSRVVMTMVQFKRLDMQEVHRYITSKEGIGKAGGYAIQGLASIFIPDIQGSYSNVVGLPLCETANLLKGMGCYDHKTVSAL